MQFFDQGWVVDALNERLLCLLLALPGFLWATGSNMPDFMAAVAPLVELLVHKDWEFCRATCVWGEGCIPSLWLGVLRSSKRKVEPVANLAVRIGEFQTCLAFAQLLLVLQGLLHQLVDPVPSFSEGAVEGVLFLGIVAEMVNLPCQPEVS